MAYSDQDRIEAIFGATAVAKWSDIDNDNDAPTMAARVATAIAWAYEEVHSILRNAHYALPLANDAGTAPETVVECEATLAGVWLYEAFGTHDYDSEGRGFHRYEYRRAWAYETLEKIVNGTRTLDAL